MMINNEIELNDGLSFNDHDFIQVVNLDVERSAVNNHLIVGILVQVTH